MLGSPTLPSVLSHRLELICNELTIKEEVRKDIVNAIHEELQQGLKAHVVYPDEYKPELCSMMMLDTYINDVPTRDVKAISYALDIGGTNSRFMRLQTTGDGQLEEKIKVRSLNSIGASSMENGLLDASVTASAFFDYFALQLKEAMIEWGDIDTMEPLKLGFCFSFASSQKGLTSSELLFWTKGFKTGQKTDDPVEHRDVGKLLSEALIRNKVPLQLAAIVSDTVGALICGAYERPAEYPPCMMSVIVGTGFNASYLEPNAAEFGYKGKLINTECGGYNKQLPRSLIDEAVDSNSECPGIQQFEKMISGLLIGEVARQSMLQVLQDEATEVMRQQNTLSSEAVFSIAEDITASLTVSRQLLNEAFDETFTFDKAMLIKTLCTAVVERSACLCACLIFALADRINRDNKGVTCGVDGSIITKRAFYLKKVNEYIAELSSSMCRSQSIKLIVATDGSGKGAALLAAAAAPNVVDSNH